ncbi:hypothetical protein HAX54_037419 [Datura stramonium]|uniref:Uncharacterized protein n=1 Tax=Datura stramonium TaxID=4076 RepID=A0ABS8SHY8_DATST|nr:hypothetical protein [Datura stramonium]
MEAWSLVDESDVFTSLSKATNEGPMSLNSHTSFSSDTRIPEHIQIFPAFYGTQLIEASDGSGWKPHFNFTGSLNCLWRFYWHFIAVTRAESMVRGSNHEEVSLIITSCGPALLITHISEILTAPNEYTTEVFSEPDQKSLISSDNGVN